MDNKSLNEHFENEAKCTGGCSFLQQMDEIITDLEKSVSQTQGIKNLENTEEYIMANQLPSLTAPLAPVTYAEKPHSEQKAFTSYIATGDLCSKGHLLSRDESSGGYLVPKDTLAQINARLKCLCPLRSLAKVDTIKSESLDLLIDKGATDVGWMLTDELEDGGSPDLAKIKILTHQLYAKPRASQKILDDVGDALEEWIVTKIAQKVAVLENAAFLHGDGDRKPNGILPYVSSHGEQKIEGVTSQSISRESLLQLVSALGSEYLSNATWLMSRRAFSAIQQITDTSGRFLWQPSLMHDAPSCLLGYPVMVSDDMLTKDSQEAEINDGPILFGDFMRAYQIVDRGELSVLRDPYSAKPYVEFYATKRVGGDMVDFDAVKALCLKAD
jgi:HK97 family phage major capsid protein